MKQSNEAYNNLNVKEDASNQLVKSIDYNGTTRDYYKGSIYSDYTVSRSAQTVLYAHENKCKDQGLMKFGSNLGHQIGEQLTDINGISVSYFEFGAVVSGVGIPQPIICKYNFPKIGNPAIVSPDQGQEIRKFINATFEPVKESTYDNIIRKNPNFFEEMFSNKFLLRAVNLEPYIDDVLLVPSIEIDIVRSPVTNEREVTVSIPLGPGPSSSLHDKTLFDLVFRFVNDFVLAPHGIYANKNWDNFVIMHVTDIHVSRRLEYAKDDLMRMSSERPDLVNESGIRHFNNFNNNFRDFIAYANFLHKIGTLDCILATGDLIDYLFDSTEQTAKMVRDVEEIDTVNGNNFDFFKRLILGLEPGRDGTKNEELLVPTFTSLGNHDYRAMPYPWAGELDPSKTDSAKDILIAGATILAALSGNPFGIFSVIFGKGNIPIPFVDNKPFQFYEPTNLFLSEAIALEGGEKVVFSPKRGLAMLSVMENLPQYNTINTQRSYIVQLGPHRIVMLDSAEDTGIIDTNIDVLLNKIGADSEDSKRFSQGSPNSQGVQQIHIDLLKQALEEAGSTGIVIVGIHAPLVDMSYYPHYLRETDRVVPDVNVMKRGFPYFAPFFSFDGDYNGSGKQPGWQMTGTPYFKFGGVDFTLAFGVSKGLNEEFLKICAGRGGSRKVDLVLSGHGHKNFESRLELDPSNNFLFFHDYYTENPTRYYATKLLSESDFNSFINESKLEQPDTFPPLGTAFAKYVEKMFYHFIIPKDGINQPVFTQFEDTQPDGQPFIQVYLEVPLYPTPLNKTGDKTGWWSKHRPLLIETAPLGPIETLNCGARNPDKRLSDYSFFHGCRKLTIKNNVISSIETVHMEEIKGYRSNLISLREFCRVRGLSFPASLRSIAKDINSIPSGMSKPRLCSIRELCRVRGISFPASLRSLAENIKGIPPISERLKTG